MLGMPYTGSGVLGSALAMDKLRTFLPHSDVPVPLPSAVVVARSLLLPQWRSSVTVAFLPFQVTRSDKSVWSIPG